MEFFEIKVGVGVWVEFGVEVGWGWSCGRGLSWGGFGLVLGKQKSINHHY